jgi:hypothetical protein
MAIRKITFCPRCKKPVEAKDYFSSSGMSDWRSDGPGVNITCSECDYSGPPVQATPEEYRKLAGKGG